MAYTDLEKRRKYQREWYKEKYDNDPGFRIKTRIRNGKNAKRNRPKYIARTREIIAVFRANGCRCGETNHNCLCAHHKDPAKKDFNIGSVISRPIKAERLIEELSKCVCMCLNCHAKLHAKLIRGLISQTD